MSLSRSFLIAFTLCSLAGCSQPLEPLPPAPENTYRIYSSFPQSGRFGAEGEQIVRAIDLAINQQPNATQLVRAEHVKLHGRADPLDESANDTEERNAQLASNDPAAIAYIGPYSSAGAASALPITNRAGLLQVGVSNTWPGLTQAGWDEGEPERYYPSGSRNYIRLWAPDSVQAEAAARWAADLGARVMLVVNDGSSYSRGMGERFRAAATAAGISVPSFLEVDPESLSELTIELRQLQPDALFYAPSSANQTVLFAQRIRGSEPSLGVFASDTALDDKFAGSPNAPQGVWRVVFNGIKSLPDSPEAERFRLTYREAYGQEPGMLAARAYDATNLILRALRADPNADRTRVLKSVLGTSQYRGAGGPISLAETGDNLTWRMTGYRLGDGLFVEERIFDADR